MKKNITSFIDSPWGQWLDIAGSKRRKDRTSFEMIVK